MLVVNATLNNGCLSAASKGVVGGVQWRQRETASPSSIVAKFDGNMGAATKKEPVILNIGLWVLGCAPTFSKVPNSISTNQPDGRTQNRFALEKKSIIDGIFFCSIK